MSTLNVDLTALARPVEDAVERARAAAWTAEPLMPPQLLAVLDVCPQTETWKTRGRPAESDLAGLRDRALLLVEFFAALRRSELAAMSVGMRTRGPFA